MRVPVSKDQLLDELHETQQALEKLRVQLTHVKRD